MTTSPTMCERTVIEKLKKANPRAYQEITRTLEANNLNNVLRALQDERIKPVAIFTFCNYFSVTTAREACNQLHTFKKTRNAIIHADNPIEFLGKNGEKVLDLILYVAAENCPELFKAKLVEHKNYTHTTFCKRINGKQADYLVRSTDEIMINRYDKEQRQIDANWFLGLEDLSNLFAARVKLVQLKNELDCWLKDYYPKLHTTILTTIDTASGYIWLPIVHKDNCKGGSDRPNLESATASLLLTPLDVRIYIDFGGHCFDDRKVYFKFIRDDSAFREFLHQLQGEDRAHFKIFDIEWYSFIINQRDVDSVESNWADWEKIVDAAEKELNLSEKSKILTSNRLLSGFIYDRSYFGREQKVDIKLITDKLSSIIDLYYALLVMKHRNKGTS